MKPFGVRLAAGAVTILLGALAVAQAQKDQQSRAQSEWVVTQLPSLDEPPMPIQASSSPDGPAPPSFSVLPPEDDASAGPAAIRLVQHSEIALPDDDSTGNATIKSSHDEQGVASSSVGPHMGFAIVDSTTGEVLNSQAAQGPSFGLPADMGEASVNESNARMSLPTMSMTFNEDQTSDAASSPPNHTIAPNPQAMPELQFEQPPTMNFAAAPSYGSAENNPANDLRSGVSQDNHGFAAPTTMPANDANGANQFSGAPQALLRSVQNLNDVSPAQPAPQVPQQSQARVIEPQATQPTLRYSQTPDMQYPQATAAPLPQNSFAAGNSFPTNARPNSVGGLPTEPAARIASLPNSDERYAPRLIDGPVVAAPIQPNPDATIASPGDRRLEGVQSPSVVIHKRAPSEVKVGKPASFVIHVQNVGSADALDVTVHDRIPVGMRLIDASPTPVQQGDALVWQLGAMSVGDERTVTMQLIPEQEGELGSVARVTFEAAASVRTMSTRPELKIVQKGPPKVLIGQQLEIELEVSNPGTGAATGVVMQEDVPDGLEHPKGRQLDNLLGTLAAGEVRRQVLRLRAVAPGVIQNQIRLTGDDGLEAVDTIEVEIVAPQLQLALNGPQRRFLERQATYQLDIANVGSADATNVEIAAHLDRGFTFVSTDYEGQYDPNQHTVFWSLANLPHGGNGTVPLTLLPVEEGEQAIRLEARADLGIVAQNERIVAVDSLAELAFSIDDVSDPIEVGGETVYEIRLSNTGSRNDTNVRVQLQLPAGMVLLGADGDAQEDGRGGIFFEPRTQLAANDEVVYRVRAQGITAGTHLVKAIVTSDHSSTPVTKEESTMVYSDR